MSERFTDHRGLVVPLDRANVDTDQILPRQYLAMIGRSGFGVHLFDQWRYLDEGRPGQDCRTRPLNPEFILNQPHYRGASVLLTRANFGCGSSREHAPWALREFGFRVLIAPSFAEIFFANCCQNGVLPVVLSDEQIEGLFVEVARCPGYSVAVDLATQTVALPDARVIDFDIDPIWRRCLLDGIDEIDLTLEQTVAIKAHEKRRRASEPWLFQDLD